MALISTTLEHGVQFACSEGGPLNITPGVIMRSRPGGQLFTADAAA